MNDANTTGAVVPGSSVIARIGVAINPEGIKVPLFPAILLVSRNNELTVVCVLVGASLSEPHTSVTAFAEVVCMYVCLFAAIYRKF